MPMKQRVIVLGGGIGGLSAAWFLSRTRAYDVTLVESAGVVGGICGTFQLDRFLFDFGPHKFYSVIPGVMEEVGRLMGIGRVA